MTTHFPNNLSPLVNLCLATLIENDALPEDISSKMPDHIRDQLPGFIHHYRTDPDFLLSSELSSQVTLLDLRYNFQKSHEAFPVPETFKRRCLAQNIIPTRKEDTLRIPIEKEVDCLAKTILKFPQIRALRLNLSIENAWEWGLIHINLAKNIASPEWLSTSS